MDWAGNIWRDLFAEGGFTREQWVLFHLWLALFVCTSTVLVLSTSRRARFIALLLNYGSSVAILTSGWLTLAAIEQVWRGAAVVALAAAGLSVLAVRRGWL